MDQPPPMPTRVRQLAARLIEVVGRELAVEYIANGRWQITISDDRVQAVLMLRQTPLGRIRLRGTSLTIDGKLLRLPRGAERLAQIFDDPDSALQAGTPAEQTLPPEHPIHHAPPVVRHHFYSLLMRMRRAKEGVKLDVNECEHGWTLTIDVEGDGLKKTSLRLNYTQRRHWGFDPQRPLDLWIDGEDRTDDTRGDMTKALRMLMRGPEAPTSTPAINGPASSQRSNAVETRRATVRRT